MPHTSGYQLIADEFRMTDDGDKWGNVRLWHYSIAEILYHNGHDIPDSWGFEDSPLHSGDEYFIDPQWDELETLRDLYESGEVTEVDIRDFGDYLHEVTQSMIKAGEDY
jgi:hypothetical protein